MAGSIASGKNPGNTATKDGAETLTNKVLVDPTIEDGVDSTKKVTVDTSNVTTGTTRNIKMPDANDTLVGKATTDTLTNKSIDAATNTVTGLSHGTEVDNPTTGVHGVTGNVVGTSDAQVITNKDIDGGTASNTNRVTVPSNTKASLDALTRKAGTVVYASDKKKMYKDDGSSLKELGGGAGSPSVYKILNTDDDDIANWINTGTGTFTFTAINPYNGDTSYNFATAAQNDQLKFIMPVPLRSQGITNSVTMNYESSAIGAELVMYDETNAVEIERFILPVTTKIEKAIVPFIVKSTATSISFRIENTHLTNTPVVKFDDIIFSDNPFTYKNLLEKDFLKVSVTTSTYTLISGVFYSYPITQTDILGGGNLFSAVNGGIKFKKDCTIDMSYVVNMGSNTGFPYYQLYDTDGITVVEDLAVTQKLNTFSWISSGATFSVKKNQTLKFVIDQMPNANAVSNTRLQVTAIAESAHVITPVKSNMSDWQSFTPTWTGATTNPSIGNGSLGGYYRRVGSNLEVSINVTMGSTTSYGVGQWYFGIPNGLSIDLTSISSPNSSYTSFGTANALNSGVNFRDAHVIYSGPTSVYVISDSQTNSWQSNLPFTWGVNDGLSLNFSVPIVGWTSDVTILGAMPKRRVAYINTSLVSFNKSVTGSTAYKTRELFSLGNNSDTSFASIASNQLTLEGGKYVIRVPLGAYQGTNYVHLLIQNITDSLVQEEFKDVSWSASTADAISYNTINFTINISTTKTYEFRTKANIAAGGEFLGRITIEKLE